MNDWQPTMNLRWVPTRYQMMDELGNVKGKASSHVLQQQWRRMGDYGVGWETEWRDVPIETEE